MAQEFRACLSCLWTFERIHTDECPQCGEKTQGTPRLDNRPWLAKENAQAEARNAKLSRTVQCCYNAKHTRGWHHDAKCPNWNVGF